MAETNAEFIIHLTIPIQHAVFRGQMSKDEVELYITLEQARVLLLKLMGLTTQAAALADLHPEQ